MLYPIQVLLSNSLLFSLVVYQLEFINYIFQGFSTYAVFKIKNFIFERSLKEKNEQFHLENTSY